MTHRPAIHFENVFFSYDSQFAFQDISLTIQQNEYVCVIGPNGGGKTTLIKLMLGLLKPTAGKISLFGKPVSHASDGLAYVPQTLQLDPQFPITVREIVLSGRLKFLPWWGRYSTKDEEIALSSLETVRLKEFLHHPFGQLSQGQKQRTLIARALASEPKLLILDEPTASVDATSAQDIYALLKKLKNHLTIVIITHDLKTAIQDATHVCLVQKTVHMLSPSEVCEHFAYGLYHTPLIPTVGH